MRFVEDIKIVDIDGDSIRVDDPFNTDGTERSLRASIVRNGDIQPETIAFKQRRIQGRTFVMPGGKDLIIGWNTSVEEAIGFPMNCFKNMHEEIRDLKINLASVEMERNRSNVECTDLLKKVKSYKRMSFFEKLKFLIKGV